MRCPKRHESCENNSIYVYWCKHDFFANSPVWDDIYICLWAIPIWVAREACRNRNLPIPHTLLLTLCLSLSLDVLSYIQLTSNKLRGSTETLYHLAQDVLKVVLQPDLLLRLQPNLQASWDTESVSSFLSRDFNCFTLHRQLSLQCSP